MPPLKNIKHEKFCQAVIEKPSYTQAYKETYGIENQRSSETASSRLLSNVEVKNRVQELLERKNCGLDRLTSRLNDHVGEKGTSALNLDAVKFGFKLFGVLDEDKNTVQADNIQINIVNIRDKKS